MVNRKVVSDCCQLPHAYREVHFPSFIAVQSPQDLVCIFSGQDYYWLRYRRCLAVSIPHPKPYSVIKELCITVGFSIVCKNANFLFNLIIYIYKTTSILLHGEL